MKDRIKKIIDSENISSARFAEILGVQRSNVSHILSGRNNPSLDFIQKVLDNFKQINIEWLMFGTEPMYKQGYETAETEHIQDEVEHPMLKETPEPNRKNSKENIPPKQRKPESRQKEQAQDLFQFINSKNVEKIIVFYTDKTFAIYSPDGLENVK